MPKVETTGSKPRFPLQNTTCNRASYLISILRYTRFQKESEWKHKFINLTVFIFTSERSHGTYIYKNGLTAF